MLISNNTYTIREYESFVRGGNASSSLKHLPEKTFDSLESFILENSVIVNKGASDFFTLGVKRGIGKTITACNYVGLIAMKDGTIIEILPKIYLKNDQNLDETKKILLTLLKSLKDITFKDFDMARLKVEKTTLFEIFISMFVQEVIALTKQGLLSSYQTIESNEQFIKGKIQHANNIKENLIHKERFALQFDEFNLNRAENRLIKTTLKYIQSITKSERNRHNIRNLIDVFSAVSFSVNIEADFSLCQSDRSITHYKKSLVWCKIFLLGNSFTSYSGSDVAIALLFPMEKVFEQFVASKIRRLIGNDVEINTQHAKYSLFVQPKKSFALKPDIYLKANEKCIVMDTKWKILNLNESNYGISQSDMYQMYAYGKKYKADRVVLLYPLTEGFQDSRFSFDSGDGVQVDVRFVDLRESETNLSNILQEYL
ncbi:MAG: McrC family protein [Erysipelotrichaceae bacterium]|nr:McrC family protein [Erysipelotrichaceae bacterium]